MPIARCQVQCGTRASKPSAEELRAAEIALLRAAAAPSQKLQQSALQTQQTIAAALMPAEKATSHDKNQHAILRH